MTGKSPPGRPHQAGRLDGDSTTRAASGPGTADPNSPPQAVPVAFYGRTAHAAGTGDSRADRYRQLALCHAVAAARGWQVTAEFFDEDCRAGYPWQRRPQGRSLLAALSEPGRVAGAVVVADPWCLLPRRPVPGGTAILARLAFRRVLLVLAGPGMVISSAEEYRPARQAPDRPLCGAPPGGSASRPSVRDHRARGSLARQPAAGLPRRSGRAQVSAALLAPGPEDSAPVRRFAFSGRVSTEDNQDPDASRNWQISRSRALIEPAGGIIVAEYFDIGQSRSLPWKRRPRAAQLLADLANPDRGFDAVVIGEPQRAFYGNQYSLTMPVFTHYGVELWVPEVGGPDRPGLRGPRPDHVGVRRHVQGRADPDQDPGPRRHVRPGRDRGTVPRRPSPLRLPHRRRRAAPQPRQGRRRQAAAQAGT